LTGKKAASKWPLQIVDGVPDPGTDCFHKDAENGIDVRITKSYAGTAKILLPGTLFQPGQIAL